MFIFLLGSGAYGILEFIVARYRRLRAIRLRAKRDRDALFMTTRPVVVCIIPVRFRENLQH